nr:hypothetical protein [Pseudomonas sp. BIGb0427]
MTTLSNRIFYRPYQDTVEGAKSGISISVRCNGATTVRLMARYPDRSGIPLGRGVRATLAIGNQDIGMVAGSTEGGYDMEMDDRWRADRFIESTLHTDGTLPEAGELSGSTWIEIFIP